MSSGCTAQDLATIRSWVGSGEPTDATLRETWKQIAATTPEEVARQVLSVRLADMLASPAQWSLSSDYNENWTINVSNLRDQLGRLDAAIGGAAIPGAPIVDCDSLGQLTRVGRQRI